MTPKQKADFAILMMAYLDAVKEADQHKQLALIEAIFGWMDAQILKAVQPYVIKSGEMKITPIDKI